MVNIYSTELIHHIAGWSSTAARRAHNPKVVGSNPTPATKWNSVEPPVQMRASTEFFDTLLTDFILFV